MACPSSSDEKITEGDKSDIWSADVFPAQLKDLSQKPALLKVLLTEISGGPCGGRRLGQVNATHRRLESYDDKTSAIPVSFAKEQDPASCPSCAEQSGDEVKALSDGGKLDGGIIALIIILSVFGAGGGGYVFHHFYVS